jgi:type I restriction enzyme M protein/adenine-specific DNA-methyltransferase
MQLCCYGFVALGHALRHVMDCVTQLSDLDTGLVEAAGQLSCRQQRAAQHSTAQHSTAQHSTAQHSTALWDICIKGSAGYGPHLLGMHVCCEGSLVSFKSVPAQHQTWTIGDPNAVVP